MPRVKKIQSHKLPAGYRGRTIKVVISTSGEDVRLIIRDPEAVPGVRTAQHKTARIDPMPPAVHFSDEIWDAYDAEVEKYRDLVDA